jgi:hypothetical protein
MNSPNPVSLEERILDCFPSGSYALAALLRLMDIVPTEAIDTAAVECRVQPRLLINPLFVERHATTPEKLLMLVMHELHHVLLGHTTLFPTVTPVENFVCDCIINALISRMFPHEEYLAFLTEYYSDTRYPECLLRPVAGWPAIGDAVPPGIVQLPETMRARVAAIHRALYSEAGATYREVYEILPKLVADGLLEGIPLLGGHGPSAATKGELDRRAPLLFDVVRNIVEQWPQPPDPIRGRSLADVLNENRVAVKRRPSSRTLLRQLIRRVAAGGRRGPVRHLATGPEPTATPIPQFDRRSIVMRALGIQPFLFASTVCAKRRVPAGERVHVYLDVSGSMDSVCDALYGAVLDCRAQVHPVVHLFSTEIADVTLVELRNGVRRSTGGTAIGCVAEHLEAHRIRRALIITDGGVGRPFGAHLEVLSRTCLAVAYAGTSIQIDDLAAVARHSAQISP